MKLDIFRKQEDTDKRTLNILYIKPKTQNTNKRCMFFSMETYVQARHRVTGVVVYTIFSDAYLNVKDVENDSSTDSISNHLS